MKTKKLLSSVRKPDITSPSQLREQARFFKAGVTHGRAKWWQVVTALVALALFAIAVVVIVIKVMWATPGLDGSKYQAVFLDDGKVFFGKLNNTDGEYITLERAYYTRSAQSAQSEQSVDQTALVEVGSESYGPDNSLQISRSKILFWQNLREDSQVSRAIENRTSSN